MLSNADAGGCVAIEHLADANVFGEHDRRLVSTGAPVDLIDYTLIMRAVEENEPSVRFDKFLRSYLLPRLVEFVHAFPALRPLLPRLAQIRIVLDANPVQRELRWRLKWRRNPAHLSALHEVIDAGLVVAYAPTYLRHEIEKHFEDIATDAGCDPRDVEREWNLFSKVIVFYDPTTTSLLTGQCEDPNDLPYLATWNELEARAICTSDHHLIETEVPVFSILIDTTLRQYARSSTVQLGVAIGSSFACFASFEALSLLHRLLVRFFDAFRKLSPAMQIGILGAVAICIAHPKCRERALAAWRHISDWLSDSAVVDAIYSMGNQWLSATDEAEQSYRKIREVLPPPRKSPLRKHLRSVCVAADSPLSLYELEKRVRRGGYESGSKTFRQYMRRVLRSDNSLREVSPGFWAYTTT
jgi:hypothetical protein